MREPRQIKSRSWNRMPSKRCSADGILNEFILVDDDEVIILDLPKSKGKAPKTSRTRNKSVLQGVISFDDTENVHKAGSSSSRKSLATKLQTSAQEKSAAFRLSKCNQTFSTMPSPGIRFGLGSESESDFPESNCSDCEILKGSDRVVHQQWEKAGLNEEAGPTNLHCGRNFRPGFESGTVQHDQTSSFFTSGTEKAGKAGLNEEAAPSNLHLDTYFRPGFESRTGKRMQKAAKENHKKKAAEQSCTKEVVEEEDASKSSLPQTSDGDDDPQPVLGVSNGARCERGFSCLGESREPIIDPIPSGQVQGLQGTAPVVDIMLNREMLKDTDEYKKAQEEEWESQLKLQAQEAQRQRKRRKLANTRQLEMETRQKERIEELRETQKKFLLFLRGRS